MRLFRIAAVVLALGSSAVAKDVTVTYSEDEQKALWSVFDAALKARGMELGGNVAFLWQKLQQAAQTQNPAAAADAKPEPVK